MALEAPSGVIRIGGAKVYAAKLATDENIWLNIDDDVP